MKQFFHLLRHDFTLLHRNNIIVISILISAVYVALFLGLKAFVDVDKFIVLIIFNDPVLLGFLFVGIMMLFEKNENTLHALAVSPMRVSRYILSKSVALTIIALFCCYAMVLAAYGFDFRFGHFTGATIATTMMFSFMGFIVVAGQSSFNNYMLRAIGVIILMGLPFLSFFGLTSRWWFILFPTLPSIELFAMSFGDEPQWGQVVMVYMATLMWCVVCYYLAHRLITKNIR